MQSTLILMSTHKAAVSEDHSIIEDASDEMSESDHKRLAIELDASLDDLDAGRIKPASEVFARFYSQC